MAAHSTPVSNGADRARLATVYRRRASWAYRHLRPPLPLVHNPRERFLPDTAGPRLFIGGAGAPPRPGFYTVDLLSFPGVAVVADVEALPFGNGTIGAIECDAVLEHVRNPDQALAEMARVLRPGGYLHAVVPFNHPFHAYPGDYHRWTLEGLRHALRNFDVVDAGVRTGPAATLLAVTLEFIRLLVPAPLEKAAYAAAGWLLWPMRGLDRWLNRRPEAHRLANSLYALARKPAGRKDTPDA